MPPIATILWTLVLVIVALQEIIFPAVERAWALLGSNSDHRAEIVRAIHSRTSAARTCFIVSLLLAAAGSAQLPIWP